MSVPDSTDWPLLVPTDDSRPCWEPSIDLVSLLRWSPYKYKGVVGKDPFLGLEDARGISSHGKLYLTGSVIVFPPRGGQYLSRVLLAKMDARLHMVTSAVVLFPSNGDECTDTSEVAQKNW